jgi:small subunit ribosomal protein S7
VPRRYKPERRDVEPDPKYGSKAVAKFINCVMRNGKKLLAQRIVYEAFDRIEKQLNRDPVEVFNRAIEHAMPVLEVKPRRVGGATYQVPVEIRHERREALARRWLIQNARKRSGRSMAEKLAHELIDAYNNTGATIKKKEDTHRMAEANRAFSHFRY